MKLIRIGIAEYAVSADPDARLITYALGSCIAVILWDPVRRIGGMLHYMLPSSKTSPEKAKQRPAMFADTGIPALFHAMYELGAKKEDIIVKVAGGAAMYDSGESLNIGKRNYAMLRKIFWKAGITIAAEDVGGTKSRTVWLDVGTGDVTVKSMGEEYPL